ncbi:MAG: dTMP kinase [Treponema sp.]|jgi:dTMP kinase|nr:dTMP kinase [Treponema sp.]
MEIISNFAVLEGGDGSGTTTQLSMLAERFKKLKKPAFFPAFEPTEGQIGQIIRRGLKGEISLKPETICLLFAADRNEHLYGVDGILAHINRGCLAVSDRYALSSLVYQGIECGDELPKIINSRFPAPELTIFLDIDPETAISRMKGRGSLDIYERLDFQKKVREKYLSVLEAYRAGGAKVRIIDALKSAQEVAEEIWSIISEMPIFST